MVFVKISGSIGLAPWASNPCANISSRLPFMALGISATTGMMACTGSARKVARALMPSMTGSEISIRIKSGLCNLA